MTIYTTPRLKLTPAEKRAAIVMEWVHECLWRGLCVPGAAQEFPPSTAVAVVLATSMYLGTGLAAIALLEEVARLVEWDDGWGMSSCWIHMHDGEEGER